MYILPCVRSYFPGISPFFLHQMHAYLVVLNPGGKETKKAMETSQSLPIESFSYRWLINLKPSFDALDGSFRASAEASDQAAFIGMDPKKFSSKMSFGDGQDFNFQTYQSPPPFLVHADEVFSNGLLMPYYLTPSKVDSFDALGFKSSSPISSESAKLVPPSNRTKQRSSLAKVWRSWKRVIRKRLGFLRARKIQDSSYSSIGYSTRDETIDACRRMVKSEGSSPRTSTVYYASDWSDIEKSIQEAVLHCKRSFEK